MYILHLIKYTYIISRMKIVRDRVHTYKNSASLVLFRQKKDDEIKTLIF